MYREFFKFSRKPFSIDPDPDFFYLTASARRAYDRIINVIGRREPYLLLSGAPGTGKTTLLKRLMADGAKSVHWIFINQALLAGDDLLVSIGQFLGLSDEDFHSDHFFDKITQKMAVLLNKGAYPVILLDEADQIERGTLQRFFKWHAFNQTRGFALTVVLAGLKKLTHTFSDAYREHSAARLVDNCNLDKFDFQEMCAAIAYRLEIGGYNGPALFEDESLKLIHDLSDGIPREINLICDLGLVLAANRQQQGVTRQIIQEASKYLLLDKDAGIDQESSKPLAPVKPAQPHPGRRVPKWRWALAGFLIVFGGGSIWFLMRSAPIQETLEISSPLTVQVRPKEAGRDTKKSTSPHVKPSDDLTRPAVPQSWTGMAREISVAQAQADNPDIADSESVDWAQPVTPQGQQPDMELARPALPPQADASNLIDPDLTDLTQSAEPQSPDDMGPGAQTLLGQVLTEPRAPVPQREALQVKAALPQLLEKKVPTAPPRPRKPDPAPKVYLDAVEPEASRSLTSQQKPQEGVRDVRDTKAAELIAVVEKGNLQDVHHFLEKGVEVDSVNDTGETALMKAAWAGRTDIITLLLSHEPRINQQSREGWTALFYGAVKGHKLIVASLLAYGARPDLADQDGRTPLMAAAWNGHVEIVKLLLAQRIDPNRKNRDGWSPLMFAALKGHVEVARVLLLHGADPAASNNDGDTSTELAAHQGHTQFLSLLSTHGQPY